MARVFRFQRATINYGDIQPERSVAYKRHPEVYIGRSTVVYPSPMGDTQHADNPWSAYLYARTSRPGWNIKKLAEASGLARQTVSDWIRKGTERGSLKLETILAVARAAGDHPVTTFMAAAELIEEEPQDREIGAILSSLHLDEENKQRMIRDVEARRQGDAENTIRIIKIIDDKAS